MKAGRDPVLSALRKFFWRRIALALLNYLNAAWNLWAYFQPSGFWMNCVCFAISLFWFGTMAILAEEAAGFIRVHKEFLKLRAELDITLEELKP